MKDYRFKLKDSENNVVKTCYSLNTVERWVRLKLNSQSIWDEEEGKEIDKVEFDLKKVGKKFDTQLKRETAKYLKIYYKE